MRRALVLAGFGVAVLTGVGCKGLVAGRCDCTHDPAGAVIGTPHNPYPVVQTGTTAPAAAPAAALDKLPMTDGK